MSEWPYFVLTVKKWPELQKEKEKRKKIKRNSFFCSNFFT